MGLISGSSHGRARNLSTIVNRTGPSGGSEGGIKKAGIGFPTSMHIRNIGNAYTYRIPSRQLNVFEMRLLTTHNPTQLRRNSYYATHSGMLG